MSKSVQLTFNGVTALIEPKQDGMYDLNDIWRVFRLPEKKRPSEWRHRDRRNLERTENLRGVNGNVSMTLATQKALFMYAAWCDYEFHDVVFETFNLVVEGKLEEAKAKADTVTLKIRKGLAKRHAPDMDVIYIRQHSGTLGLTPKHCYPVVMKLICKTATGINPAD